MPRIIFLFLVAGLLFLLDLYVFQAFGIAFQASPEAVQTGISILFWSFSAATIITLFLAAISPQAVSSSVRKKYWLSFIFIVFAAKLLVALILFAEDLTRLVRWI